MKGLIEVKLVGLILDPVSKGPVMVLKPIDNEKIIPIWIGKAEADAITMELESISAPRPMTHDLIKNILVHLDSGVEKVVITHILENTYYAELYLKKDDRVIIIDSRPSDAIAIALKNRSKIYISESVYSKSVLSDFFDDFLNNEDRLDNWFNSLCSDDFGSTEQ